MAWNISIFFFIFLKHLFCVQKLSLLRSLLCPGAKKQNVTNMCDSIISFLYLQRNTLFCTYMYVCTYICVCVCVFLWCAYMYIIFFGVLLISSPTNSQSDLLNSPVSPKATSLTDESSSQHRATTRKSIHPGCNRTIPSAISSALNLQSRLLNTGNANEHP